MCEILREMDKVTKIIEAIEDEIGRIEQEKIGLDEAGVDRCNGEIVLLEQRLETELFVMDNLSKLMEYKNGCKHDYVLDLVDIDPDRSAVVKYCKHCLHVPGDDD